MRCELAEQTVRIAVDEDWMTRAQISDGSVKERRMINGLRLAFSANGRILAAEEKFISERAKLLVDDRLPRDVDGLRLSIQESARRSRQCISVHCWYVRVRFDA
jgi:hypothetical protein